MKLTILGTGCAWTKRACASYLLNNNIMIDPGFGSIKQLLKSDEKALHHEKIERIDLVIITHFHSDHYFDIPYILQKSCTGKFTDRKLTIISPPGGKETITKLCELGLDLTTVKKMDLERYIVCEEAQTGVPIKWRNLTIVPYEMEHGTTQNFGYMITQPSGKKIGFTGDTILTKNYIKLLDECDTVVACMSSTKKENKLFNIVEGIDLMKQYSGRTCIIPAHMTSQGWDYARTRIRVPNDLEVFDLEDKLPYDYNLKKAAVKKNPSNRLYAKKFHQLYGSKVILTLIRTIKGENPAYQWNIINRQGGKKVGTITYYINNNEYTEYNGNVTYEANTTAYKLISNGLRLIKSVAETYGTEALYLSASPDNMEARNICERLGATLRHIKTIGEEEKKYIDNDDKERCIYILKIK